MNPLQELHLRLTRRSFLSRTTTGIGSLALASLLRPQAFSQSASDAQAGKWRGVVNPTHWAPRAKRVIYLCMAGGPSHLETLDYKPALAELHGKPMPESFTKGQQIAQLQGQKLNCLGPQHTFSLHGQSGQQISDALPHI